MTKRIQIRRGTTSQWTTSNPILASGEFGYDTILKKIKLGDGITEWTSLTFYELENPLITVVDQIGHGFTVNQAVYLSANDTYALARADNPDTSLVSGVVSEIVDSNSFVLARNGAELATSLSSGVYFLSAITAGLLTTTKPNGAGTFEVRVVVSVTGQSEVSVDGPYDNTPLANSDLGVMPANTIKANLLEASATPQDATYSQLLAEILPGGTDNQVLTRTETGYAWENATSGSVSLQPPQVISSETIDLNTIPHLTSWTTTLGANWNPNFTNLSGNVGKRFRGYITNPSTYTVTWVNVATLAGVVQTTTNRMDVYEFEVLDANRIVGWRIVANIPADAIAPTVTAATINTAGTQLTVTFSEAVTVGAGGNGGWTLGGLGTAATLSSFTLAGDNLSATLLISRAITAVELPTLAYTQPGNGVEDLAGNDLATFSGGGITNSSTVSGYLVSEDFEGTGTPAGWTTNGSPNFDYSTAPAPLLGAQSLFVNSASVRADVGFASQPTAEGYLLYRINSIANAPFIARLQNGSSVICGFRILSNGAIRLVDGANSTLATSSTGVASAATTYHVWWRFVNGGGSNGVLRVWLSTTATKPGSPTTEFTTGVWTQDLNVLSLATVAVGEAVYDKVRVSSSVIGSDPS